MAPLFSQSDNFKFPELLPIIPATVSPSISPLLTQLFIINSSAYVDPLDPLYIIHIPAV